MAKSKKSKSVPLSSFEEQFLEDFTKFTTFADNVIPDLTATFFKWKDEPFRLVLSSRLLRNPVELIVHRGLVDIWRDIDGLELVATIALDDETLWSQIIGHAIIAELVVGLAKV